MNHIKLTNPSGGGVGLLWGASRGQHLHKSVITILRTLLATEQATTRRTNQIKKVAGKIFFIFFI